MGGSSGINIAGAIKMAKKMGPGKTIVTILCDHGKRYASKIFNKNFLKSLILFLIGLFLMEFFYDIRWSLLIRF